MQTNSEQLSDLHWYPSDMSVAVLRKFSLAALSCCPFHLAALSVQSVVSVG